MSKKHDTIVETKLVQPKVNVSRPDKKDLKSMIEIIKVISFEKLKKETLDDARNYGFHDIVYKIQMSENIPLS